MGGVLAAALIKKCEDVCKNNCQACKGGLRLSILHLEHKLSLLDKFRAFLDDSREIVTFKINDIYNAVDFKLPHSGDKIYDQKAYCNSARIFILNVTAESLFYGGYITENTIVSSTTSFILKLI